MTSEQNIIFTYMKYVLGYDHCTFYHVHLIVNCSRTQNGIEILVGLVRFKLCIKIVKMFLLITQEPLGLPKIVMLTLSSLDNFLKYAYHFSK